MLNIGHVINADRRCDTKLIFLNEVENNNVRCVKEQKNESEFLGLFLHLGREQNTLDLKISWSRQRRRRGHTGKMVPLCHGHGLPFLLEGC